MLGHMFPQLREPSRLLRQNKSSHLRHMTTLYVRAGLDDDIVNEHAVTVRQGAIRRQKHVYRRSEGHLQDQAVGSRSPALFRYFRRSPDHAINLVSSLDECLLMNSKLDRIPDLSPQARVIGYVPEAPLPSIQCL